MVDIHCHILPHFDDGSTSLDESLAMARMAVSSGVEAIVVTPHFPGEAASLRRIPTLVQRYHQLQRLLEEEEVPLKLYLGSEILCLPETPALAARQELPTIGNTCYFLSEFYFNESQTYMDEMLSALAECGYTPVVAHPERYKAVQLNPMVVERWFAKGYVLQLNKGSILGAFGPRIQRTARTLLNAGLIHVIASDAHRATHRTPHMGALRQWLAENCDPEYARILLEENPSRLIQGQPMCPAR